MILFLLACGDAFVNDAPRLLAVNGVEVERVLADDVLPEGHPAFQVVPGEPFDIVVEWTDPDGDAVDVWWPRAPGGWVFDPDGTRGTWDVPADAFVRPAEVILRDDHPENPRSNGYIVPFWE